MRVTRALCDLIPSSQPQAENFGWRLALAKVITDSKERHQVLAELFNETDSLELRVQIVEVTTDENVLLKMYEGLKSLCVFLGDFPNALKYAKLVGPGNFSEAELHRMLNVLVSQMKSDMFRDLMNYIMANHDPVE